MPKRIGEKNENTINRIRLAFNVGLFHLDLMVKFDRASVISLLDVGEVTLTITGEIAGTSFECWDTIKVIDQ